MVHPQLRVIVTGFQWMVHWWVLGSHDHPGGRERERDGSRGSIHGAHSLGVKKNPFCTKE
jgi:hypothetical protein